jgi:hypothetical protein
VTDQGGSEPPHPPEASPAGASPTVAAAQHVPVLPTAQSLLGSSLELAFRSSRSLRGASLWIAVQALGLLGPVAVLLVIVLNRDPDAILRLGESPAFLTSNEQAIQAAFSWGAGVATIGLIVLWIESRIVAAALLGGAATQTPLSLRESIRRSRQSFWRVVRTVLLIELPLGLVSEIVALRVAGSGGQTEVGGLLGSAVTTVLGAPFAYSLCGVVLGDVGAIESIRRSTRLARVRWRLALALSILATLSRYVLVFALAAGGDVLGRIGLALGPGVEPGSGTALPVVVLLLFGCAALGSLLFTVSGLAVAPQVVAFLGLTQYDAGLDRARPGGSGPERVRWLSWGMRMAIGLALLASAIGIQIADTS